MTWIDRLFGLGWLFVGLSAAVLSVIEDDPLPRGVVVCGVLIGALAASLAASRRAAREEERLAGTARRPSTEATPIG